MADTNTQPKPTDLDLIGGKTLNRYSTGEEVKALQRYLQGNGYQNVKPDGHFGPITEQAVKDFQKANGLSVDGVFGPQSLGKAVKMGGTTDVGGPGGAGAGDGMPKTQAELDAYILELNKKALSNPVWQGSNSKQDIDYAIATGDYSTLKTADGKPFSDVYQQEAYNQAEQPLQKAYGEQTQYDTSTTESNLGQQQLDYQNYLDTQGANFEKDKTALDQNAADSGVLFSGGRVQKEKALSDTYNRDQAYKQATVGSNIGDTAEKFQYKYGDNAAKGLSKYYNLGSNTYNPNVATGGVGTGGLSSMYNPSGKGYMGTAPAQQKADIHTGAGLLMKNRANKLLSTGYQNKL